MEDLSNKAEYIITATILCKKVAMRRARVLPVKYGMVALVLALKEE